MDDKVLTVLKKCLTLVEHELEFRPDESPESGRRLRDELKEIIFRHELRTEMASGGIKLRQPSHCGCGKPYPADAAANLGERWAIDGEEMCRECYVKRIHKSQPCGNPSCHNCYGKPLSEPVFTCSKCEATFSAHQMHPIGEVSFPPAHPNNNGLRCDGSFQLPKLHGTWDSPTVSTSIDDVVAVMRKSFPDSDEPTIIGGD